MKGRNTGKITLRLVRRIQKPNGGFGGVIFAAIDVERITAFFAALNLGPNSSATLIGTDKRIRARSSYGRREPGQDISGSEIWRELALNPVGLYKGRSVVDDVTRYNAYRRLVEFPLIVAIGVAVKDISAVVTATEIPTYAIALLITLVIVIVTVVFCRKILRAQIDVAERIKAEQRFKDFVGASSDYFWKMDANRRFSYFSNSFSDVTGVPISMLLGKTREETGIPDVEPQVWQRQLDDLAAHRPFRNFIHPRIMPDGSIIHLSINGTPVFNEASEFTGYRGTGSDVTERAAMEEALRRARDRLERRVEERTRELRDGEARFRAVVDNSPAAITLKDTQGRYLIVNKIHRKWMNAETRDYLGKTVQDLMPGAYTDAIAAHENLVIQNGVQIEKERHAMFPDGIARTIWAHKFPILGPDGDCTRVGTINIDVTEQRNIESQLRQAQKMEAVGQLTGGIAHDFNSLLGIIIGNLDLLAEGLQDNADILILAEAATNAALSGAALNRQLLAFSRKQTLSPKVIDLNPHLSGMFDMLRRALGETIEIKAMPSEGPWTANVDPGQLQSAVLNLAVNAKDAMPDGCTLTFETRKLRLDDEYAAARSEVTAGEYVFLAVTDTGTGMPPDVLAQVFEPFSPPRMSAKARGLAFPWCSVSPSSRAAMSRSKARSARGRR